MKKIMTVLILINFLSFSLFAEAPKSECANGETNCLPTTTTPVNQCEVGDQTCEGTLASKPVNCDSTNVNSVGGLSKCELNGGTATVLPKTTFNRKPVFKTKSDGTVVPAGVTTEKSQ